MKHAAFTVVAHPRYIARESDPSTRRYVFAYTITISNTGAVAGTLRNRHWIITNADGERQEVRGRGVVGEEPLIEPGKSFTYTSAAVIETPVGTMHGDYEFEIDGGAKILAPIRAFSLSVPNLVH
ncbi:MAG: Co2+/Mg2+ efflux protein ApaG [Gammaproteobacteria bacterium]|nr:Co2+/Mg2+ efflux protein ApaG [Gammaproteobacteria bacterium]